MKTIFSNKKTQLYLLVGIGLFLMAGCAGLVQTKPGMRSIHVTSEPVETRVTLTSMGTRKMQTYFTPATIEYDVTPAIPPYITVSKAGYQSKNIRLDGKTSSVHVVLEKEILVDYSGFGVDNDSPGSGQRGPQRTP